MFTRQHYKAIAVIIASGDTDCASGCGVLFLIIHKLADYFTKDNERFDREKFLEACGL